MDITLKIAFLLLFSYQPVISAQTDRAATIARAHALMEADSSDAARRNFKTIARGAQDSLAGVALHNLGVLAYRADDLPQAVNYFRRAVEVRDEVFLGRPHNERAHSRTNLAYMYRLEDKLDSTALRIREAADIYAKLPEVDSLNWLRSLNELGALALSQENFLMGYSSSHRAVRLSEEMGGGYPDDAFLSNYRAARILLRLDKAGEALPIALRAADLAAGLNRPQARADALNLLAIVQRSTGDRDGAFISLTAAAALPLNPVKDALTMAFIRANLAEYHAHRKDFPLFDRYDREARALFDRAVSMREYFLLDFIPEALYRRGDLPAAIDRLDEAIGFLTGRDPNGLTVKSIDRGSADVVPIARLIELRALVLAALDRSGEAIRAYDLLFALQDLLREGVSDHASRSYYSRNLRPAFDRAVALHHHLYVESGDTAALWRAFTLGERARAYSLLAGLQSARTMGSEETGLLERIARLERQRSLGERDVGDELSTARLALERLYYRQREAVPLLHPELNRRDLVEYLRDNEASLLEYHLSDEANLLFTLDGRGKLSVYELSAAPLISERVNDFRKAIDEGKYRRKSLRQPIEQEALDRRFLLAGTELAEMLLPAEVRGKGPLLIVPDGSLHYLPFAALPLEEGELPLDYRKVNYLHRAAVLRFAYSSAYLLEVNAQPADTFSVTVAAFAPTFGKAESAPAQNRTAAREVLIAGTDLGGLTYNEAEVREIASLIKGAELYTGPAATKGNFLKVAGRARILHLSSHGLVDPQDPNLSFIAFSQPGGLNREELLYFNDLYRLPLNNELTVLSACETALGRLDAGETTMSMATAFTAAGARSIVTTLWQVDDEATKKAIVSFYRHLGAGLSRATALHDAQTELLDGEYAHPYYWSGLTLYGMSGPLDLGGGEGDGLLPWWGWAIALLLLAGLLVYFLKFLYDARPVL